MDMNYEAPNTNPFFDVDMNYEVLECYRLMASISTNIIFLSCSRGFHFQFQVDNHESEHYIFFVVWRADIPSKSYRGLA